MKRDKLTAERLRQVLSYDPLTGLFERIIKHHLSFTGRFAGSFDQKGYLHVRVDGIQYRAHRLAWLYCYGDFPKGEIDHIDGDKTNNTIGNLRDVTSLTNSENRKSAHRNNRAGTLGVGSFGGKWRARIMVKGRAIQIGTFESPEAARTAYVQAKRRLHAGCTL